MSISFEKLDTETRYTYYISAGNESVITPMNELVPETNYAFYVTAESDVGELRRGSSSCMA